MKYFVILLVLVGFVGVAFGQYLGDKLPPETMIIDDTGEYVFPPSYSDFYYSDPRFDHYFVTEGIYRYDIPYMISNGTISNMRIDCDSVELILDFEHSDQGWLTLALPRQLIDSQIGSKKDVFFVLADSKETQHSDIASEKLRLLIILISNGTSQINIIGLNYPEQMGENACNGKHEPPFSYLLFPLKQFKSGIAIDEIQCKESLILVAKHNGFPACTNLDSIPKLIERRWIGNIDSDSIDGRDVGYISLYALLQYAESDQIIAIDFEGPQNYVEQFIESYNLSIMSSKTTSDGSFSSNYGNITKINLEKFFDENPRSALSKQGVTIYPLGGFADNTGTYGPFNKFVNDKELQQIGKLFGGIENEN